MIRHELTIVLDVAIGLVFTYLILSLIASEFQELLATVLQWRAKHLKDSIEILLAGGVGTKEEQRVKDLVGRLYDDPLLKNVNQEAKGVVARGFRRISKALFVGNREGAFGPGLATGPSYISPETFATSLIERLGISQLVDKLTEVRVEKFARRIIGSYNINEQGQIEIPSDETFKADWEKGNIRVVAEKAFKQNLNLDQNFLLLVEDYDQIVKTFKAGQLSIEASIARLGEELDNYIVACENPQFQDTDLSLFVRRLRSFKTSIFGENNERAILSGGLKPSLTEIAELVNQGSTTYKEVIDAYQKVSQDAEPIDARVKATIASQVDSYNAEYNAKLVEYNQSAQALTTFDDLPREQQQIILSNALGELTLDERQLYEDYQAYRQIKGGLDKVPESVKESIGILARRAQTRVRKAENELNQLQEEVAVWFDRSMARTSGVYKRNAKGVAILIGLSIAAATNSDTFHIFNRLSSDDSLRRLVTERAAALPLTAPDNPRLDAQLETLKNQTDAVLKDIAFPISWSPNNLNRQLGCQAVSVVEQNPQQDDVSQLQRQWVNLYKSCLNEQAVTDAPIPFQVAQIILSRPLGFLRMISGWALSGIAIAMGAPFWFDLLGKLVNVRNSGNKPKPTPEQSPPT
ncbi:MAG: hypothetical protein HC780_10070 [Leptolyngbyaceae cyanobacterium CSU_1_3]|nr:hypothetical protein [Leptolyngbyaceae cyanobacterium CSU_1_3]